MLKWKKEYGSLRARSFSIEESKDDFILRKSGQFVACFATEQSCKKVARCIWRELGKTKADYTQSLPTKQSQLMKPIK